MFKNIPSQKIAVFAYNTNTSAPQTGDAANITAYISKDGGAAAATNDVNPTELDATNAKGLYLFDMLQAESNADLVILSPVSSTSNVTLEPVIIYTQTVMRGTDSAYTGTPPTATAIVNEWESQSQTDPTGFQVNVLEVNGTAQTANDNGADINAILVDTNELQTNQGNWLTATGFATTSALATHDAALGAVYLQTTDILVDTGTTIPDQITALNNVSVADLNTACDTVTVTSMAADVLTASALNADAVTEIINALKTSTGYSAGGVYTFANVQKLLLAWATGKWQDKAGASGTYELLDPDDGTTVIMEVTPSATTPYKTVSVL